MNKIRRQGVTVVELLVTITVLGILSALLLPAVQQSREASRRAQCVAHLGTLATACHSFESSTGHLPGGYLSRGFSASIPAEHRTVLSVWVSLLPFLDQAALHEQIDPDETGYYGGGQQIPPGGIVNIRHTQTPLPVLCCPSDNVPDGWCSYRVCRGSFFGGIQLARTAGALNAGLREYPPLTSGWVDGASHTVMFSERLTGDARFDVIHPQRDVVVTLQNFYQGSMSQPIDEFVNYCQAQSPVGHASQSFGGSTWILNGYLFTWYNHATGPNWSWSDCSESYVGDIGTYGPRSLHTGGVNVVMADGSGHFMSDAVDLKVWRAMGTRAGGESEQ